MSIPCLKLDEEKLLPEYLMLWFSRPEFDRYARFKSHGSVREIMDWDEMCKVDVYKRQSQPLLSKADTERPSSTYKLNFTLFTKMLTVNRAFALIDVEIHRISWYNNYV